MSQTTDITRNSFLQSLSPASLDRLMRSANVVSLRHGMVVRRRGETVRSVYFPLDAVFALTIKTAGGKTAEAAMLGAREVVGIEGLGDINAGLAECTVTVGGSAVEIAWPEFQRLFDQDPEFRNRMLAALQTTLTRVALSVACSQFHLLEQRYARWLLEVHDRCGADTVRVTHNDSASLLGVRRSGVTNTVTNFTAREAVEGHRGTITIKDRGTLETISCECYSLLRSEGERLARPV